MVILDLGLPGIDGIEVVEGLRGWTEVPIIVLSVRDDEPDKVAALDAGADDYVTKPFGMDELLARLRAALRRDVPDRRGAAVDRDRRLHRSTWPPSGSPPTATRCASPRPSGASSRSSCATGGKLVSAAPAAPGGVGPAVRRRRPTTCASTSPHSAASSSPSRRRPRYFITEPGMGYRFEGPEPGPVG